MYVLLAISAVAGGLGLITVPYILFLAVIFGIGGYLAYQRAVRPALPDRRLFDQLIAAGRPHGLLPTTAVAEGRAGAAGAPLKAPLSLRPAILVHHDVFVRGTRVAHCTSGGELLVRGADATARVIGPVEVDAAPLAARQGRRAEPALLIDGQPIPLGLLRHVFGERAQIEERVIAEGDRVEVRAEPDQLEVVAEPGADAYRTAAVTVIHGRPGRPARVSRPAG